MTNRERFEAYLLERNCWPATMQFDRYADGDIHGGQYVYPQFERDWQTWQEATKAATEIIAQYRKNKNGLTPLPVGVPDACDDLIALLEKS